ncbi:hypothetical protein GTW43_31560, partial [Streptomyces sp. SID5785]|nr:hypothetical protein [Streptomyces sp. SID5785]
MGERARPVPVRVPRAGRAVALASAALLSLFALLVPSAPSAPAPGHGPWTSAAAAPSWEHHGPDGTGLHAVLTGHAVRGTPPDVPWHHKPGLLPPSAADPLPRRLPGRTEAGSVPVARADRP